MTPIEEARGWLSAQVSDEISARGQSIQGRPKAGIRSDMVVEDQPSIS